MALTQEQLAEYRKRCEMFGVDEKGRPGWDPKTEECQACKVEEPDLYEACKTECEPLMKSVSAPPQEDQAEDERLAPVADEAVEPIIKDEVETPTAQEEAQEDQTEEPEEPEEPEAEPVEEVEEAEGSDVDDEETTQESAQETAQETTKRPKRAKAVLAAVVNVIMSQQGEFRAREVAEQVVRQTGCTEVTATTRVNFALSFGRLYGVVERTRWGTYRWVGAEKNQ